jgi:ABC-type dipeptide/oligopeptide/nickel transport system permease subunit
MVIINGIRLSLIIGVVGGFFSTLIGVIIGFIAGYVGR